MTSTLPAPMRAFLAVDSLAPLWQAAARHLQRRELEARGKIRVTLDEEGATRLGQLLGALVRPGQVQVDLATLDHAMRASAAACGLVPAVGDLTGTVLVDKGAADAAAGQAWAQVWQELDTVFADRGLAGADWVAPVVANLRRTGLLKRAGVAVAAAAVQTLGGVLDRVHLPDSSTATSGVEGRGWQLAELAGIVTGDAHALDGTTLAATLVLRVLAGAAGLASPSTSAQIRRVWDSVGVSTDKVSGTVLVWALRPPGLGAWAQMMGQRADLGLVTHLTLAELEVATAPVVAGQRVWMCENPQVLQAATRAGVTEPFVCTSGNPSAAGWQLLHALVAAGAEVAYHGDFDWPGMEIAGRILAAGARPWRLTAQDYSAVVAGAAGAGLELTGAPVGTWWDPDLSVAMRASGVAVHEEACLAVLLEDLGPRAQVR